MARPNSIRISIRTKLVGIINFILITAAGAIVVFATTLFSKDNVARVQESNLESARLLGVQIRGDFAHLTEKMRLMGITLLQPMSPSQLKAVQAPFFEREKDLLALSVTTRQRGQPRAVGRSSNDARVKELDVSIEDIYGLHKITDDKKGFQGEASIEAGQLKGSIPVLTLRIPLISDDRGNITHIAIATILQDRLLQAVKGEGIITNYLVDTQGYLLAHPDQERVLKRQNLAHLGVVKQLLSGKTNNGQTRFLDPQTQDAYLGAFTAVGFAGIGVISQVLESKALEAAAKVRTTSILITGIVAVAAFVIVFFFSLSLSRPLLSLVDATAEIARGNYEVQLRKKSNDEIGDLTQAFGEMAVGLAEREKIKGAFAKFHSKEMADLVLKGELKLGGERKNATVFFSDVRGFTAMSEKMDPEQLVAVLNRYMTRMVRIIMAHNGIVDKYVGDAIMAVWGVPVAKENDIKNAIMACIEMRKALAELNEELIAEGLPTLKIGMGLNYGTLVSGNIGSEERMEFTVIGDTVNTASRVESVTKDFGTDLLVSQALLDQVPGQFVTEAASAITVKGKTEPLQLYKIYGYVDENGQQVLVHTPYSSYKAEKSEKSGKMAESKEKKDEPQQEAPGAVTLAPFPEEGSRPKIIRASRTRTDLTAVPPTSEKTSAPQLPRPPDGSLNLVLSPPSHASTSLSSIPIPPPPTDEMTNPRLHIMTRIDVTRGTPPPFKKAG